MPQSPLMTSSPSPFALVPFVSVEHMMKIVNTIGLQQVIRDMAGYIEADFKRWHSFDKREESGRPFH